tara:strand:- start:95 stop:559 length:465 start_codon:yes stop_codon:yes gene_type:complete
MNIIKNIINYSLIIILSLFITKSLLAEEFGSKDEALALLDRAISLVQEDRNRALDLFTSGEGGLHPKDLYPFCLKDNGILLGHPTSVGLNITDFQDSSGKYVGKELIKIAKYNEINEVDFVIARLTTDDKNEYVKTQLVTRVSDLICVVGYYSE